MLSKDNFLMYAMKAYDNPSCKTLIEFESDLSKFNHLVKLASRDMGNIETNLLLNYVMTLLNIFKTEDCIKMMFFKVKFEDWYKLKTVLVFLERMPESIAELGVSSEVKICDSMMIILNKI